MEMGESGDVDGSMAMAQQADVFKRQHETLMKNATQPERSMTVCDICGIFISSTDNDLRRAVGGVGGGGGGGGGGGCQGFRGCGGCFMFHGGQTSSSLCWPLRAEKAAKRCEPAA